MRHREGVDLPKLEHVAYDALRSLAHSCNATTVGGLLRSKPSNADVSRCAATRYFARSKERRQSSPTMTISSTSKGSKAMATRSLQAKSKSKSSRATSSRSGKSGPDAIVMLREDHTRVSALFKQFQKIVDNGSEADKQGLVARICDELKVHTTLEEEIFYPAARAALAEAGEDLLDEAEVEHASAKDLIAQLVSASPDDALYDAKVTVLGEYIKHHVKEEQEEMFPKCRKAKMDLRSVGAEMATRKEQLADMPGSRRR